MIIKASDKYQLHMNSYITFDPNQLLTKVLNTM